jgi:hypothetical protein
VSRTDELYMTLPSSEDAYAAWRSAADGAAEALQAWVACPAARRGAAFRAYVQALDREEDRALAFERDRRSARLLWWHR